VAFISPRGLGSQSVIDTVVACPFVRSCFLIPTQVRQQVRSSQRFSNCDIAQTPNCLVLERLVQFSDHPLVKFAKHWLSGVGLLLIGATTLFGQDSWQGPSGSWFIESNWSSGVPTSSDTAIVDNGTTVQIVDGEAFVNRLIVGGTHSGSTVVVGSGGFLSMTNPLQIQNGGTFIYDGGQTRDNGNIVDNGTLEIIGGYTGLNVNVSGTGEVVINETAILQIVPNTSLTYTGPTLLVGGTLQAGFAGAFSPNSAFTVNSTLDLNGFNNTIGSLSGTGIVVNNGTAAATLTVGSDNTNSVFSGVLEDGSTATLALTKVGTGTLTLTGTNTYTGGTTINGGTLQLGNGGTTGSIVGNVIDNSILALDRSDVFTFGGLISGTGSVEQIGTGTTVLTADNAYRGGTTISAGTLQLGNGGTSGSIVGNVTDNGTLAFDRSDILTFSGVISGTGGVEQIGTGTTILTADNTYVGGTTINGGTLQLGNGGTAGSIAGNVINNGILAFDHSDAFTFAGTISGTGGIQQIGAGTTVLTGNNTYRGGTTISAGTLQLGNGGTTGSIVGNVTDNGTLAFDRSDILTFSGVISGTGGVEQIGTGTTVLTATNTYTGQTTVDDGSLIVDGSIAGTQVVVNPRGLLGGSGLISANVLNSGIISAGNPTGTLTVSGNYTQRSNGTLRIQVGGTAAGQFGLLAISGHATLSGTLQIVPINGFQLAVGNKLTFLTATGGVSGNFSTIQNLVPISTAVAAQFVFLPNSVEIEATQGSFVSVLQSLGSVVTPNELAVAKALDSARGDPREAALFAFLNSQPIANLPHDLSLIAPTQVSSINASVSIGKVQISNIGQRMANIHAGSTGFSSSGFTLNGEATTFGNGLAGETGAEGKSGPSVLAPVPENRWGFFVTGLGEFTNVDSTPNADGYDVNTGGITLGVDYRVTPYFAVGLLGGYAHNNVSLVGGGNIDVNGGTFGAYATLFGNGFYLDTAVTGGPNGYDTHRTALQGSANGSTEGADLNVVVSAGYDWKHGNFSIGPTASFAFGYVGLDGFSETGSLAPLKFPDQNTESETTAFGARAMYEWKIRNITLIPQVSAAWQHEYGSVAYQVIAGFASGAGTNFTVNGPEIGRDSLLIGAGVSIIWSDRFSTYVFYDGDVARTNYDSHTVTGGFRITF
jgi:autotransporter-associated beta strand protein